MKIELEGTVFCVAGRFTRFDSAARVRDALEGGGAKVLKTMGQSVEVLVFGAGYSDKPDQAAERGLPILDEYDLAALLRDGVVEVDFEPPSMPSGDSSLDDLLGEARAALATPASTRTWDALVDLLNQCDAAQVGPLADYVHDRTARWTARERMLCVAPQEWTRAMLRGEDSPAFRAARRVNLWSADAGTKALRSLLACGSLAHVTMLDVSTRTKLSKTAFRAIAQSPLFATLEELTIGHAEPGWAAGFDQGEAPARLHTLGFGPADNLPIKDAASAELFTTGAFARVERLVFFEHIPNGVRLARVLAQLGAGGLPAFSHLELDFVRIHQGSGTYSRLDMDAFERNVKGLPASTLRRARTLTLRTRIDHVPHRKRPLDLTPFTGLRTLRLFDAGLYRSRGVTLRDFDGMFRADRLVLPDSVERVVTNAPVDQGAFARLASLRPDLEVAQDPHEHPFTP
jgi:hypothetical protein